MARSPNYPAHALGDAIGFVKQVYDRDKRTVISTEDVAKALGYSTVSGNARTKIASMKQYDLLDGEEGKGLRVSELAVHILYPASQAEAQTYKRKAALAPSLFGHLYEEKREGHDESIQNYLISKMNFTPTGAAQAVDSFRQTLIFAGLDGTPYNASNTPEVAEAKSMATEAKTPDEITRSLRVRDHLPDDQHNGQTVNAWTWTLSMPRSVRAELRIVGDVTKGDVARLKKQIESLEESFDDTEAAQ